MALPILIPISPSDKGCVTIPYPCSVTISSYKTQIDYDLQSLMSYNNMLHTGDYHYQRYDSVQDNPPHLPLKSISVKGHYRYV